MMEEVNQEPRAIQLISIDANKQFHINEDAILLIQSFQQKCKNFAVMVVVGKYRTGKSYLINQVLLQKNNGFNVGSTINACTKGLWMWSELIYFTSSKSNEPIPTLLLDTEGIGSMDEEQNHDVKIFLLAMLFSSYLLYNSVGTIDDMALQNLGLIVNLTKLLQKGDEQEQKDIYDSFPSFLWILRDFSLKLEDEYGNKISAKEYLENALKPIKGVSETIENKNKLRRHIMQFFGERDCFTLVRPVEDEKQLQQLNTLSLGMLRPEFQEQVQILRKKFSFKINLKQYRGKPVTPFGFVEMCKHFVDAINKGNIPMIQTQWSIVCKFEMKRIYDDCIRLYDKELEDFIGQSGINKEQLEVRHSLAVRKVKQFMEENSLDKDESDFKGYKKLLKVELDKKIRFYSLTMQDIHEEEQRNLKDSFLVQVQENDWNNLWDLGEYAQKALLEFIEQGGSGTSLYSLIEELWAELMKKLQLEIHTYKTKISQTQDEVISMKISKDDLQAELKQLEESHQEIKRTFDCQMVQQKFELEQENKKTQAIGVQVRRLQIQLENKSQEYMAKFKSIESSYQDQLQEKDISNKSLENRLQQALIESAIIQGIQKQQEQQHAIDIRQLKKEISRHNEELSDKQDLINKMKDNMKSLADDRQQDSKSNDQHKWSMQKDFFENQLKTQQQQLEDHKRFNETLISTILSSKQQSSDQCSEQNTLIATNNRLGKAVEMSEARSRDLELQINKLKKFQKLIKFSSAVECRYCLKLQKTNFFESHLTVCRKRNTQKTKSSQNNHPHFDVSLSTDDQNQKEYQIQVSMQNNQWLINKSQSKILQFAQQIQDYYLEIGIPFLDQFEKLKGDDDQRSAILHFINEISFQKEVRNYPIYRQFFQINQEYPMISDLNLQENENDRTNGIDKTDRQNRQKMSMDYNNQDQDQLSSRGRIPLYPTQKKTLLQMFQQQKHNDKEQEKLKKSQQIENSLLRRNNKHANSINNQLK